MNPCDDEEIDVGPFEGPDAHDLGGLFNIIAEWLTHVDLSAGLTEGQCVESEAEILGARTGEIMVRLAAEGYLDPIRPRWEPEPEPLTIFQLGGRCSPPSDRPPQPSDVPPDLKRLVEEYLRASQASRPLKDSQERIPGSAKERCAYRRFAAEARLRDESTGVSQPGKRQLWPHVDAKAAKSRGCSPGVVRYAMLLRRFLPEPAVVPREMRDAYVEMVTEIQRTVSIPGSTSDALMKVAALYRAFETRILDPAALRARIGHAFVSACLLDPQTSQQLLDLDEFDTWCWLPAIDSSAPTYEFRYPRLRPAFDVVDRHGGPAVGPVSVQALEERLGLRAIEFGNTLTNRRAARNAQAFFEALVDLDALVPVSVPALNRAGGLALGFGTRGNRRHRASFYPSLRIINLTQKKGDGTVAHEWAHFLDYLLGVPGRTWSATCASSGQAANPEIEKAFRHVMALINRGQRGKTIQWRFPAESLVRYRVRGETLEQALDDVRQRCPLCRTSSGLVSKRVHNRFRWLAHWFGMPSILVTFRLDTSRFYFASLMQRDPYWTKHSELFARAFEAYVARLLKRAGWRNNFLVAGFDEGDPRYPYPAGEEGALIDAAIGSLLDAISIYGP